MAKTGKDDDKPIVPDRDGPSPLDYNVDSEKALIAFRETVSRRERGTGSRENRHVRPRPNAGIRS
jgi:hypothetical protein